MQCLLWWNFKKIRIYNRIALHNSELIPGEAGLVDDGVGGLLRELLEPPGHPQQLSGGQWGRYTAEAGVLGRSKFVCGPKDVLQDLPRLTGQLRDNLQLLDLTGCIKFLTPGCDWE